MSSDNTDRVIKDLSRTIDLLPSPAIGVVLNSWRKRVDRIKSQLDYTGGHSEVAIREVWVLENCIAEIKAANLIDRGNSVEALRILLNND
jgi:hypothetical protein